MNAETKKALATVQFAYECFNYNGQLDEDFIADIMKRLTKAGGKKALMAHKFVADDIMEEFNPSDHPFVKAAVMAYMEQVDWEAVGSWMLANI